MDIYRIRTNNKTSSDREKTHYFYEDSITVQQIVEFDHEIGAKKKNKKTSDSRTKQSKQSELVSETWLKLNIQSDPIAFHF